MDSDKFGRKEVTLILDDLSIQGKHEMRKEIIDSIKEQDKDEAYYEYTLLIGLSTIFAFAANFIGRKIATHYLTKYFDS